MTPEEIALALQAFLELEPEVQKGIVELIHLIHTPKPVIPAPIVTTIPGTPASDASTPLRESKGL